MLFKKSLSSSLLLAIVFLILLTTSSVDVLATSVTIQTNFLDASAVWVNKLNQITDASTNPKNNTSVVNSPYRVTMTSNDVDYTFIMSVGAYVPGTPDRVIFGAFTATLTGYYNLAHSSSLDSFEPLTSATYAAVIALHEDLCYAKVTSITFSYANGTRDDVHHLTVIYSYNQGVTWNKESNDQSLATGSSSGSITFSALTIQHSDVRVGLLFENTFNYANNDINMSNPQVSITTSPMTATEQANQFASEIENYTLCATVGNGMIQLTSPKQQAFIDKYQRLTPEAKSLLNSIPMGAGFTAMDRYLFLIHGTF